MRRQYIYQNYCQSYMRPIIDIGNIYSPSYMPSGRSLILDSQRNRRHSSSITRERRSNSKNQKFDMAVNNIASINSSINGLLNIVDRSRGNHVVQRGTIDKVLSSSRQKYSSNTYQRINYSSNLTTVSSFRTPYSNNKVRSPSTTRNQLAFQQKHAAIKYSKESLKPNGGNLNKQSQSLAEPSKNSISKLNIKGAFHSGSSNKQVDNWWENLLTEVDRGNKDVKFNKQQNKNHSIKPQ